MAEKKDLYEILGVSRDASENDIKKAAKKLLKKYHPDVQPKDATLEQKKEAEEKFKEINEAKEILTDPEKRRNYDMFGSTSASQGNNYNPWADMMSQHRNAMRYAPGSDIRMRVPLTIEEIVNGCTKKLKYKKDVRCPHCHGKGGSGETTCPDCGGTGIHVQRFQRGNTVFQSSSTCETCNGTGFYVKDKCTHCGGSGFVKEEHIQEVEFPAGLGDGEVLGVRGAGSEAKDPHGNNGDFVIQINHNYDHDVYDIQGLNLIQKVRIPFYDALLGTKINVQHPNGKTYKINIPECTQPNYTVQHNSLGLSREGYYGLETGKYILVVNYDIPVKLTKNQKKLLEEFKKEEEK